MPSPRGYVRTTRDNRLLAFVGIARYASAEQLHRLFFGGVSKKQTYRRLGKLCEPGGQPGEGPCLRRLGYRRRDGTEVPVWALAPFGRSIASRQVPWLRPPAASDIGHRFLEHTLVLNEVLVTLVAMLRRGPQEPLCDLLFRWLCEGDDVLTYRVLHPQTGRWLAAVLKPDAVLTIPARKRRLFIEAETGSQSIATAHPDRTGAVLSKLGRYRQFFVARSDAGDKSWYQGAFADGFLPRLLFLVHSDERRRKVLRAVTEQLGLLPPPQFKVIVMTFAEAPDRLAPYIRGTGEAAPPRSDRIVTFEEAALPRVREGFNAVAHTVNALREIIVAHNRRGGPQLELPPMPLEAIKALQTFVKQVLDAGHRPDAVPTGHPVSGPSR